MSLILIFTILFFTQLSELFVNASQLTRFYSIEEGLGYGRIRISLLFRLVEAKLPPNLLGFDTGTLELRDISVKPDADNTSLDLTKCELRIKTSKSDGSEKMARKTARRRNDGSVVWVHQPGDDSDVNAVMPVRQRYGSALLLSFKDATASSGLKRTSGRHALAVLWLRDVVDNVSGPVRIALWQAKNGDFSRLKLNYVPPDGDLAYWDSDRENVRRVGTVEMDLKFVPGISERHRKMLDGGGSSQKEAWDAFTRERAGGLRDAVGEMQVRGDEASASEEEGRKEGDVGRGESGGAEAKVVAGDQSEGTTDGPVDAAAGDSRAGDDGSSRPDMNTMVSTDAVENLSLGSKSTEEDEQQDGGDGGEEKKGLMQKVKEWKENEADLHRDHRGIKQLKPARTAEWIKDNVEEGAHAVKERFSMRSRKPDVETEV